MSEKEINEFFKNKLKELLKQRNMTYREFGEAMNLKPSTISMWNSGRSLPRMDVLEKIAEYFNVSPSYLIGWNTWDDAIDFKIEKLIQELSKKDLNQDEISSLARKIETLFEEQKQIENAIKENASNNFVASFDRDEYTSEELEEIKKYAEFLKSKRKYKE